MSEILKESKTKVEYSAEKPYTDSKKPKIKVVTQETDLTIKGDNEVETNHKTTKSVNPILINILYCSRVKGWAHASFL